jgi:hypothetical protein
VFDLHANTLQRCFEVLASSLFQRGRWLAVTHLGKTPFLFLQVLIPIHFASSSLSSVNGRVIRGHIHAVLIYAVIDVQAVAGDRLGALLDLGSNL